VGKESDLPLQFGAQGFRPVNMQLCRSPQQAEGRNHAYQTKAMITMQMGDKHMTELRKPYAAFAQLHLSTLSAVEHQHLVAHLNDL
jgi:hypothetical protein